MERHAFAMKVKEGQKAALLHERGLRIQRRKIITQGGRKNY